MVSLSEKYKLDQPVIILGVHRSGTSLLTRMMQELGLFVGNDVQGDCESKVILAMSNRYLNKTKSTWDRPYYPEPKDLINNEIARLFELNYEVIADQFGPMKGFWGMKDPRMAATLPLWLDMFPGAHIVYIRRSPAYIARSLFERHQDHIKRGIFPSEGSFKAGNIVFTQRCKTFEGALGLALDQTASIERMLADGTIKSHVAVSYDTLVRDPLYELARIGYYLKQQFSRENLLTAARMPRQQAIADANTVVDQYFPYLTT